jgi:hypothetical protein
VIAKTVIRYLFVSSVEYRSFVVLSGASWYMFVVLNRDLGSSIKTHYHSVIISSAGTNTIHNHLCIYYLVSLLEVQLHIKIYQFASKSVNLSYIFSLVF